MKNKARPTEIKKKSKAGLKPRLRFPEFKDAGEWKKIPIFELGEIITGNTPSTANPRNYGGERLFVSPADISSQRYVKATKTTLSNQGFNAGRAIKPLSIMFVCIGSTIGKVAQNVFECITNQQINTVIPYSDFSNDFIFFNLDMHAGKIAELAGKQAVPIINKTTFSNIKLPFTKFSEQQKIADCLSSVDELIAAQAQKIESLKDHKKGLMQRLFPAEGETRPRLRFPEFKNAGEWEEKLMYDLYTFKATSSFFREQLSYTHGTVKNIHYGDIHVRFSALFDISNEFVPFINESESLGKIKNDSYCIEGDMIFADASEDLKDIGKSIEIINLNHERILSGLHTLLARLKKSTMIVGFGSYLFQSSKIRNQIKKEAQGTKVLGISSKRLSQVEICYPKDKHEQQKIADCLSTLDELIAAHTQKLGTLKEHKKGLMQQLFPVIDKAQQ